MKSIKKVFSSLLATTLLLIVSTAQAETSYWSTITNSGTENSAAPYNIYDPIGERIYLMLNNIDNAGINYKRYRVEINLSNFVTSPEKDQYGDDYLLLTSSDFDVNLSLEFATATDQAAFEQLFNNNLWVNGAVGNWLTGVDFSESWKIDGSATLTSATGENDPVFDNLFTTKLLAGVLVEDPPTGEYVWKLDWNVDVEPNFDRRHIWSNSFLLANEALAWRGNTTALAYEYEEILDVDNEIIGYTLLSGIDPDDMFPTDIRWAMECEMDTSGSGNNLCRYGNNWYFSNEAAALAMDQWLLDTPHDPATHDSEQDQIASFMLSPSLASYPDNVRTRSLADFSGGTLPGHMSTDYLNVILPSLMFQDSGPFLNEVFTNELIFTVAQDSDGDGVNDSDDLNPTVVCSNKITVTNANDSGAGSLRQALIDICPASTLHRWDYAGLITFDADYTINLLTQLFIAQNLTIDATGKTIVIDNGGTKRLLSINEGVDANLRNLRLVNGAANSGATNGGAIKNIGNLSIDACHFENNQASDSGGAILSTFQGTLKISRTAFISNISGNNGGAIVARGNVAIENSVFAENEATTGIGGAIYISNIPSDISIINSTFYENQAGTDGDAIYVATSSQSPTYNLSNVLVINSSPNTDCAGTTTITTNNNNWIQDGSCSATYTGDPELYDPANGDYRPIPSSGAIDMGTNVGAPTIDFAGVARPLNSTTDIGAFEYDPAGDFDGDGSIDTADNCLLASNDQLDTDGDFYGNACDSDFNNDNIVNSLDLGTFRDDFFKTGALNTDINGDTVVNSLDLGLFKQQFLKVPGPSGLNP